MYATKSWAQRRLELGLPPRSPFSTPYRVRPIVVHRDYIGDLSTILAKELVEKIGFDVLKDQKKRKGNPIKNTMELIIPVFSGLIDKTVKELVNTGKIQKEVMDAVMQNLSNQTLNKIDKLLSEHLRD